MYPVNPKNEASASLFQQPARGATSDSYTPVTGDVGRYLRATATYDDGYSSGKSASAISENTVRAVPVNNDPPRFLSSFERRSVDENTAPG